MIIVNPGPRPPGLNDENKVGWQTGVTQQAYRFVHCSVHDLSEVGLDPLQSSEWVMDNAGAPILGGRLIFAFPCVPGVGRPAVPPPVAFFGMAQYMYVFNVQAGISYSCQGGAFGGGAAALQTGKEVAFPYRIYGYALEVYDINPPAVAPAPAPAVGRDSCCIVC